MILPPLVFPVVTYLVLLCNGLFELIKGRWMEGEKGEDGFRVLTNTDELLGRENETGD